MADKPLVLPLLSSKLRKAAGQLRYLPRALALVWAAARRWTTAWAALLAVQGLLPLALVYLTRPLVNRTIAAVKAGGAWESLRPALVIVVAMAAVTLLAEALRTAIGWVRTHQSELVQDHINGLIHRKSVEADLAFYDSPEFYDHLHRARLEASYRPVMLLESLGGLLQNGITLAAMLAVLVPFGLWLPLALFLSTLPALYVALRYTVRQHEWRLRTTADERRTWYYDWLLTSREAASELRLFALGGRFQAAYRSLRARLRGEKLELATGQALAELGAGALAIVLTGACMVAMVWRAVRGLITLGDLALFYQAFQQGLWLMRSLLDNLGQLYYSSLFLGNLLEFLALEPTVLSPPSPQPAPAALRTGIRFRNVTFRYPGCPEPVLRDFTLDIPAGRIVAFVGPNGAGKSTFVKLLCRFYDPGQGRIELDGADVRDLSIEELRRRITVLFQEPVRYSTTVSENVALGDAQALARAFLRRAPILILDEPTSAMDPWAEADWIAGFRSLAAGRTAVLITHRLTTAMRADVIHVMSGGKVVESGAHQELLSRGGLYAQSWLAQTAIPAAVP